MTVTVLPVNDQPSFAHQGDVEVDEDAGGSGTVTVAGWAYRISPGPANEAGQALTFQVTGNDNPALFAVPPAVDAGTGALTFTVAANVYGQAHVTVVLRDDGGTANGGSDSSAPVPFTITVNPVNDPPVLAPIGPKTVAAGSTLAFTVSASDVDDTQLTYSAAGLPAGASFDPATRTFTWTPTAAQAGTHAVTFTVADPHGLTDAETVAITVTGGAGAGGAGGFAGGGAGGGGAGGGAGGAGGGGLLALASVGAPAGPATVPVVEAVVDPGQGAAVQDEAGSTRLEVPAGVVASPPGASLRVSVAAVNPADVPALLATASVPPGVSVVPRALVFHAELVVGDGASPVRSFARPVTVSVRLLPEELGRVSDPERVGFFRVNEDGSLGFVGGRLVGTDLVVQLSGFSTYVLGEVRTSFPDLSGQWEWARRDVELLASKFIVRGVAGGRFNPGAPVTRAEFAAFLTRALGLTVGRGADGAGARPRFKDVNPGDWFFGEVMAAAGAGLVNGFGDGTFRPGEPVTREQVAAMVARALRQRASGAGLRGREAEEMLARFLDGGEVSAWARRDVAYAVRAGIMSGKGPGRAGGTAAQGSAGSGGSAGSAGSGGSGGAGGLGRLDPDSKATRAEAAAMVARLWRRL